MKTINVIIEKPRAINVRTEKPTINAIFNNLHMVGTAAIAKICLLDLSEYETLSTRSPDTLYFVRG